MRYPRFSIIVPTRNRITELRRALISLQTQTADLFEVIVVDDASGPSTRVDLLIDSLEDPRFYLVRLPEHSERIIAWTTGINGALGEWLVRVDSDDEIASHYLEVVTQAIQDYPEAKCFNFGAVVHHRKKRDVGVVRYTNTSIRRTFKPKWLGDRHEEFKSGKIGTGSFVFHRSVLEEIEWLPQVSSPYKLHEMATDIHHLYPYPGAPLGNPYGDDWLCFYRITRKFQSIPLAPCLYIQHARV